MRALFFVVGLFAVMQGAVCLGVDSMTLTERAANQFRDLVGDGRELSVPVWFGPTLVFTGAVTLLYSIALPAKKSR